jgi:hypothetical protein
MEQEIKEIENEIAGLESELSIVRGQIANATPEELASFRQHEADILEDLAEAKAELALIKK